MDYILNHNKNKIIACLLTLVLVTGLFFYTFPASEGSYVTDGNEELRDNISIDNFENESLINTAAGINWPNGGAPYNRQRTINEQYDTQLTFVDEKTFAPANGLKALKITNSKIQKNAKQFPYIGMYLNILYSEALNFTACDTISFRIYFKDQVPDAGNLLISFAHGFAEDGMEVRYYNLTDKGFVANSWNTVKIPMSDFVGMGATSSANDWSQIDSICMKWIGDTYTQTPINTNLDSITWYIDDIRAFRENQDFPIFESFDSGYAFSNANLDDTTNKELSDITKFNPERNATCYMESDNVMQGNGALTMESSDVNVGRTGDTGPTIYETFNNAIDFSDVDTFEFEFMLTNDSGYNNPTQTLNKGYFQINFVDTTEKGLEGREDGYNMKFYFTVNGKEDGEPLVPGYWYTMSFSKSDCIHIRDYVNWNRITGLRIFFSHKSVSDPATGPFKCRLDDFRASSVKVPTLVDVDDIVTPNINSDDDFYGVIKSGVSIEPAPSYYTQNKTEMLITCNSVNASDDMYRHSVSFQLPTQKDLSSYAGSQCYVRVPIYCYGDVPSSSVTMTLDLSSRRDFEQGYYSEISADNLFKNHWTNIDFQIPTNAQANMNGPNQNTTMSFIRMLRLSFLVPSSESDIVGKEFRIGDIKVLKKSNNDSMPILDSMSDVGTRAENIYNTSVSSVSGSSVPAYNNNVTSGYDDGRTALKIESLGQTPKRASINDTVWLNNCTILPFYFPKNTKDYSTIEIDFYSEIALPRGSIEFNFINQDHNAYLNGYDVKLDVNQIIPGWNKIRIPKFPKVYDPSMNENFIYCDGYETADWSNIRKISFSYYQILADDSTPNTVPVTFYIDTIYCSNWHYEQNADHIVSQIDSLYNLALESPNEYTSIDSSSAHADQLNRYNNIVSEISMLDARWDLYSDNISDGKYYKYFTQFNHDGYEQNKIYPPKKSNDGLSIIFSKYYPEKYAKLLSVKEQLDKRTNISVKTASLNGRHYDSVDFGSDTSVNVAQNGSVSTKFTYTNTSSTFTTNDKIMPYITVVDGAGNNSIPNGTSILVKQVGDNIGTNAYYYKSSATVNGWLPFSSFTKNENTTTTTKFCTVEGVSYPSANLTVEYIVIVDFANCPTLPTANSTYSVKFKINDITDNSNNIIYSSSDTVNIKTKRTDPTISSSSSDLGEFTQYKAISTITSYNVGTANVTGDTFYNGKYYSVVYEIKSPSNSYIIPSGTLFKYNDSTCSVRKNRYIMANSAVISDSSISGSHSFTMDFSEATQNLVPGTYVLYKHLYITKNSSYPFTDSPVATTTCTFTIVAPTHFNVTLPEESRLLKRTNATTTLPFAITTNLNGDSAGGNLKFEIQEKRDDGIYRTLKFSDFADVPTSYGSLDSTGKVFTFTNSTIPSSFNLTVKSSEYTKYTYRYLFTFTSNSNNDLSYQIPINVVFSYDGMLYVDSSNDGGEIEWDDFF